MFPIYQQSSRERRVTNLELNNVAIALGTFDGMHLGHLPVLKNATLSGFTPVVVTFGNPPKSFLKQTNPELLLGSSSKQKMFREMGFKRVETLEFEQVKNILPEEFLQNMLEKYHPKLISCGFNYRFGKNAGGDALLLSDFCSKNGIRCVTVEPVSIDGTVVSSSRIREYIKTGKPEQAAKMLGRPFFFEQSVVNGDRRGRTIGFPTINQVYDPEMVVPKFGVYATHTELQGQRYLSVTNVGIRPTYRLDYVLAETHILGYDGDAYGQEAKIEFDGFIREETKFSSITELKNAIERDKNTRTKNKTWNT